MIRVATASARAPALAAGSSFSGAVVRNREPAFRRAFRFPARLPGVMIPVPNQTTRWQDWGWQYHPVS
jgi:uncharacterized protein (DUF3084 family)